MVGQGHGERPRRAKELLNESPAFFRPSSGRIARQFRTATHQTIFVSQRQQQPVQNIRVMAIASRRLPMSRLSDASRFDRVPSKKARSLSGRREDAYGAIVDEVEGSRRIYLTTPGFLTVQMIIEENPDLIATVPRELVTKFAVYYEASGRNRAPVEGARPLMQALRNVLTEEQGISNVTWE